VGKDPEDGIWNPGNELGGLFSEKTSRQCGQYGRRGRRDFLKKLCKKLCAD